MASETCVKKSSFTLFVLLAMAAGCFAWLFLSFDNMSSSLNCILDELKAARESPNEIVRSGASELETGQTKEAIDNMEKYVPLAGVFVIVPGAFNIIWLLLASLCACRTDEGKGYYCAKTFIFLANVFLILGIAFYAAIAVAGYGVDQDPIKEYRDDFDRTCHEKEIELHAEIADAAAQVRRIPEGTEQHRQAVEALDVANDGLALMSNMCDCLSDVFPALQKLMYPAMGAAAVFLITLFWVQAMCCFMGCCKNAGAEQQKPNRDKDAVQFVSP